MCELASCGPFLYSIPLWYFEPLPPGISPRVVKFLGRTGRTGRTQSGDIGGSASALGGGQPCGAVALRGGPIGWRLTCSTPGACLLPADTFCPRGQKVLLDLVLPTRIFLRSPTSHAAQSHARRLLTVCSSFGPCAARDCRAQERSLSED